MPREVAALSFESQRPAGRSTSLYWSEKAFVVLTALQVHALLLRAVAFPPQWRVPARWLCVFSLDFARLDALGSAGDSSAGDALRDVGVGARAAWAGAFALAWAGALAVRRALLARAAAARRPREHLREALDAWLLALAALLYCPASLAFAAFYSSFWPGAGGAAPLAAWAPGGDGAFGNAATAGSARLGVGRFRLDAAVVAVTLLPAALAICVGAPLVLLDAAARATVHAAPARHELSLRRCEAEFELGLSRAWLADHAWVAAPFRRGRAGWALPRSLGLWALLSGALAWLAAGAAAAPGAQADAMFALLALWSLRQQLSGGAFRCASTNALANCALLPACVTAFFGAMRAHGTQNELTVDSQLAAILRAVNVAGAGAGAIVLVAAALVGRGWPQRLASEPAMAPAFEALRAAKALLGGPGAGAGVGGGAGARARAAALAEAAAQASDLVALDGGDGRAAWWEDQRSSRLRAKDPSVSASASASAETPSPASGSSTSLFGASAADALAASSTSLASLTGASAGDSGGAGAGAGAGTGAGAGVGAGDGAGARGFAAHGAGAADEDEKLLNSARTFGAIAATPRLRVAAAAAARRRGGALAAMSLSARADTAPPDGATAVEAGPAAPSPLAGAPPASPAELEAGVVSALGALVLELERQRQRPLILVDERALLAAAARLQLPFADAIAARHALAPSCAAAAEEAAALLLEARARGAIGGHALFRGPPPMLPWLRARLDQRTRAFILLPPGRTRVLLKLLAINAIVGRRRLRPLYIQGVNDALFLGRPPAPAPAARGAATATAAAAAAAAATAAANVEAREADEDSRESAEYERLLDAALMGR